MQYILDIYQDYKVLIIPAIVWFISQLIKLIITLITERRLVFSQLVSMGGMPSAHSATVTALAITIGKTQGWGSPLFALSVFFALIVMYDAGGVRRTVGTQSVVLNKILDELLKGNLEFDERLREFIGHTMLQIVIGAMLGVGLAWWWA